MSRAPILKVEDLWLDAPGGRPLIRELRLSMGADRVALVGRNGVGKSTLLEVLSGEELPRQGLVTCNGRRVLVRQNLGSTTALSPGERRKLALEDAFQVRPALLLLDEPTRDLDARSVEWLVERLRTWRGALIVVTHDRRVLRQFRDFFVVAESGCQAFTGTFDGLVDELERTDAACTRKYVQNLARLLDKEQHNATVRRRRARKKNVGRIRELRRCPARIRLNGKRSYKQVSQGTRAVLQRERISGLREWAKSARRALSVVLPLEVVIPPLPADSGAPIVTLKGVSAHAHGRCLFEGIGLEIRRERLAVTGPNGSGKTTLLNIIAGARRPDSGQVSAEPARLGFIAQNAENWCSPDSLLERLVTGSEASTIDDAAKLLVSHKFPLALAERPLASLSPGERVRAALICLFQRRPAVELLVLDEPTDDLDLLAISALEATLRAWPGGLLIASHDAEFLRAVRVRHYRRLIA